MLLTGLLLLFNVVFIASQEQKSLFTRFRMCKSHVTSRLTPRTVQRLALCSMMFALLTVSPYVSKYVALLIHVQIIQTGSVVQLIHMRLYFDATVHRIVLWHQ